MNHLPPTFSCVFRFDMAFEDFVLVGVFSKRQDAEQCEAELKAQDAKITSGIGTLSMDAIRQQVLKEVAMVLKPLKGLVHSGPVTVIDRDFSVAKAV